METWEELLPPCTPSRPDSHAAQLSAGAQEGGKQLDKCFLPLQRLRHRGLSHKAGPISRQTNVCVPRHSPGWRSAPPFEITLKPCKSLANTEPESSSAFPGRGGFLPAFHMREVEEQSFCKVLPHTPKPENLTELSFL